MHLRKLGYARRVSKNRRLTATTNGTRKTQRRSIPVFGVEMTISGKIVEASRFREIEFSRAKICILFLLPLLLLVIRDNFTFIYSPSQDVLVFSSLSGKIRPCVKEKAEGSFESPKLEGREETRRRHRGSRAQSDCRLHFRCHSAMRISLRGRRTFAAEDDSEIESSDTGVRLTRRRRLANASATRHFTSGRI